MAALRRQPFRDRHDPYARLVAAGVDATSSRKRALASVVLACTVVDEVGRLAGEAKTAPIQRFIQAAAPAFVDTLFVPRIGRAYRVLTENDRKRLRESLMACEPSRPWVEEKVARAFFEERTSVYARDWRVAINTVQPDEGRSMTVAGTGAVVRPAEAEAVRSGTGSTQSDRPTDRSASLPVSLTGKWVGVYHVYPQYQKFSVEFAGVAADGTYSAEMRVDALNGDRAPQMGMLSVQAVFDSVARTIDITPTSANRGATNGMGQFHGVYDAERKIFGGVSDRASSDASPYFVLAREGSARELFLDELSDAEKVGARSSMGRRPLFGVLQSAAAFGRVPGDDKLREWGLQFVKEFPTTDAYTSESGQLALKSRNLFRDEYFERFFGKPYDRLNGGELGRISGALRSTKPPRANFPEERANGVLLAVERGFNEGSGTYASMDMTLSVLGARTISAWRSQIVALYATVTPSAYALNALAVVERESDRALRYFWPSERTILSSTILSARTRLAGPVAVALTDSLIASARDFRAFDALREVSASGGIAFDRSSPMPLRASGRRGGLSGEPAAAQLLEDLRPALALAPADVRREQTARARAKAVTLIAGEIPTDRTALNSLGNGEAGLLAGIAWYARLSQKYRGFENETVVQGLMAELGRVRSAQLAAAEAGLSQRIAAASLTGDVSAVVARYLAVPSDARDVVGARVMAAAAARTNQIERELADARAAARQAAQSASQGSTPTSARAATPTAPATVSARSARATGALARTAFNASGLANEALLTSIFAGEFDKLWLDRDNGLLQTLFQSYLDACAVKCLLTLPQPPVEMTQQVCKAWTETRRNGMLVGTQCDLWEPVGRKLYADPRLWSSLVALSESQTLNGLRSVLRLITDKDGLGSMGQQLSQGLSLKNDVPQLVQMNACDSPAMRRFEDNLVLLSQGKQGITLSGKTIAESVPFRESNYAALSTALIVSDARKWAFNRLDPQSIDGVTVIARDGQGRPSRLAGTYAFEGMNGRTRGSFSIAFTDGAPDCLFFSDAPSTCRSIDRRIAQSYLTGEYWLR